ncbi:hypothetical protein BDR22DRAFT_825188 [Usnea florida]
MASFSLVDAVLDLVALASTATVTVMLILRLQPLYERVKDSWRANQQPEGRSLLLWSALLILITWVATAALYCRELSSTWNFMGICLENETVNRSLYALLHLHLFLLLACGGYGLAITVFEIFQNRTMLGDLFTIARLSTMHYQQIEDQEAHADSSSTYPVNADNEASSAVSNVRISSLPPQDEDSRSIDYESQKIVAPMRASTNQPEDMMEEEDNWPGPDVPCGVIVTRAVYGASRLSKQQHSLTLDSDGDKVIMTPSSPSTSDDSSNSSDTDEPGYVTDKDDRNDRRSVRPREALENRRRKHTNHQYSTNQGGWVEKDGDDDNAENDPYGLYYATPRLSPQDLNARKDIEPLDITRTPASPCDSCSSAHASSIPIAKRSPVRVPTTPTSPTADANDADTEKTDVDAEQKQRVERRFRSLMKGAGQGPDTNGSRWSRAHAPDQPGNRTTPTIPHSSTPKSSPNPRPSSPSSPAPRSSSCSSSKTLSPQHSDPEAGLYWHAREADELLRAAASAPHDEYLSLAWAIEEREKLSAAGEATFGTSGRPAAESERRGKGSGKGGKERGLVIEIPSMGC